MFNYYLFLLSFFATNSRKEKKKNRDRKNIDLLKPKTHLLPLPPILLLLQRYLTLSDISISSLHRYVISIDFLFEFPHIFFFFFHPFISFFFLQTEIRECYCFVLVIIHVETLYHRYLRTTRLSWRNHFSRRNVSLRSLFLILLGLNIFARFKN